MEYINTLITIIPILGFIIITILIIICYLMNKSINCNDDQYLLDRTCMACYNFENDDSIITNSCSRCDGPDLIDCQHATCKIGYYSVYNEDFAECNPCRTQTGCANNITDKCYNINNLDDTYKCEIGKNLDGFYINQNGVANICPNGTFSFANEGTITGCNKCIIQSGCKPGFEYENCLILSGHENKLGCSINGNIEGYYIDNTLISHQCPIGEYNLEEQNNPDGCTVCTSQDYCSAGNSSTECSLIDGFKDKLLCL